VKDSSYKCEPAGAAGTIIGGPAPDEHNSSSLTFWRVSYADGITGWSADNYLTRKYLAPLPNVLSLVVNGVNIFAGTSEGVFLSTNSGKSWKAINAGLTSSAIWCLAVSGANIFAGTDYHPGVSGGGVFLSTNSGENWTAAGLPNVPVRALAVNGTNLFAGIYGNGVYLSTNTGTTWTAVNSGLTNSNVQSLAVSDTNLFAGTDGGGVFLSTNNGTDWTQVNAGMGNFSVWSLLTNGTNLFAGTLSAGVYLSTNNCATWTMMNSGFAPPNTGVYVYSFAVSGAAIFAGTGPVWEWGGVFVSTDSANSWSQIGLADVFVHALAISGTNLFAGGIGIWRNSLSGVLPIQLVSFNAETFSNNGVALTWTTVSETNNYGFYVQRDGKDITFIAGQGTTLQQHTYSYTDNPSPGQYKYRLRQVDLNGTVTFSESVTIDVSTPHKFTLAQNYPNPFNPSTQIVFSTTKEGPVSLRVYDILGREVATLVNGNRKPGEYTERFDGGRVASGVYMYVLQSGDGRLTRRMILSK